MARSAYFRSMLSSGLREDTSGEVDLTGDRDADEASLSVLLRFILGDAWEGPRDDAQLNFRVRALADRYQLPRLLDLAEANLHRLLNPTSVLSFLGNVVGSGGPLEEACWELMDSHGAQVVEASEGDVDAIVEQNARLAKRLILWGAGAGACGSSGSSAGTAALRKRQRMR